MRIYLTTALCVCVFACCGTRGLLTGDKNNIAVNNLRKQLMQENYDYSDSYETQTVRLRANTKLYEIESNNVFNKTLYLKNDDKKGVTVENKPVIANKFDYFTGLDLFDDSQMSYENDMDKIYKKPLEHPISVKDLLYYMDEEKLLKGKLGPETREIIARRSMDYRPPGKKYKFLKMRHQYRRKSPRRFIQEEGSEGVVVINLDNGTFPEFRLPRSRRQYMHDHGEVAAEEKEIPPPVISRLVAGADKKTSNRSTSVM